MFLKKLILAVGVAVTLATPVTAQVIGGEVNMTLDREGDLSIFGGEITIDGRIGGELRVIGGDITLNAAVGSDANVAGGSVHIGGTIGGDLSAAGGEIDLTAAVAGDADLAAGLIHVEGPVGGSLSAAGGVVELEREFTAGDGVDVIAEQIIFRGTITGNSELTGDEITIEGRVDGDVETYADYVRVTPGAHITGRLIHRGPNEPDVGEGATISGGVDYTYEAYIDEFDFGDFDGINLDFDFFPAAPVIGAFFVAAYFLMFLIAAALMPNGVSRMVSEFREKPVVAPLIGFVIWAFWPIIMVFGIILLAITIVGALLVPFWVLIVFMVLSLSYPFGAAAVGDMIFNRRGEGLGLGMRFVSTLVVLVAAGALWVVPILGVVAWCLLTWIGLGAWTFALGGKENGAALPKVETAAA